MTRRTATKRTIKRVPKKDTKPARKFGWCMDGHHDECRVEYLNWIGERRTCGCACHTRRKR